jgi:hypothetical protein
VTVGVAVSGREILDDVKWTFRFLEERRGMVCTRADYSREHFGNVVVDYRCPNLFFRITRDRLQFFFSVGPSEDAALEGYQLLKLAGAAAEIEALEREEWRSLDRVGAVAEKHLPAIEALFRTGATDELVRTKREYADRLQEMISKMRKR